MTNPHLSAELAGVDGVDVAWDQGNHQWWDWYMSLAENDSEDSLLAVLPQPAPVQPLSLEQLEDELDQPYALPDGALEHFRTQTFVKLPGVLSPGALALLNRQLSELFVRRLGAEPGLGFASLEMMWLEDPALRAFALSPRLGRLVADLLEVTDVRLYHDNALSKEPGCGRTPWHYDAHHFPLESHSVATLWAPLLAVPREMGPLSFARGTDVWERVRDLDFDKHGTSYDAAVRRQFRETGVEVEDGPFALGEVSVHSCLCCHEAGPNRTTTARRVLATTYFADGARRKDSSTMINGDVSEFLPGVGPGEVAATERNPITSRLP